MDGSLVRGLLCLIPVVVAACADLHPGPSAERPNVPAVRLADRPSIAIGGAIDDTVTFSRVARVIGLSDDGLIVANQSNPPSVARFDSAGRALWILGRQGEGPGEFRMIADLFLLSPDSIIAYDYANSRLTYLGPEGNVLGTTRIQHYPDPRGPLAVVYRGVLPDGSFVALHNYENEHSEVIDGRYWVPVLHVAADGSMLSGPLAVVPGGDLAPGGRRPLFSRASVVRVDGNRLLVAGFDSLLVQVRHLDTGDTAVYYRAVPRRVVRPEMIEALKELQLAQVRDRGPETRGWRAQIEQRFAEATWRDTLPVVQSVISNFPTELWVQHYLAPTDSVRIWTVFHKDGSLKGELMVPRAFSIMAVTTDRVIGVWRDENDVESVRSYARLGES